MMYGATVLKDIIFPAIAKRVVTVGSRERLPGVDDS
jgi:hypothetical protein